jgi:hypothetical protein
MTSLIRWNRAIVFVLLIATGLFASANLKAGDGSCCGIYMGSECYLDVGDGCDDGCDNRNFPDCCEGTSGICY